MITYIQALYAEIIIYIVASAFLFLFLVFSILAVFYLSRKNNILAGKQLEDVKNNHEKKILETQLEIQEQTFLDISREIHDNIGLSLTSAKLQLNTINYTSVHKSRENVEYAVELISKAIDDLRDLSKSLNTETIKHQGLYNTLKAETEKINRSGKYAVDFMEEGTTVFLDAHKELILYRIAQEALNNILKHAEATHIWIKLSYETGFINLSIADNGIGFDKNKFESDKHGKTNSGLLNMRTRATALNATCNISSQPFNGTSIYIRAPY